jgi:hypothetical protein
MSARRRQVLLAVAVLLFLVPLTALTGLIAALSYPAYPIPDPGALQILFDIGMVLQIGGIVAAWRLVGRYLGGGRRAGRAGLEGTSRIWLVLLGAGAFVGLVGAGVAVEHAVNPRDAADHVGFALLCPAFVLAPFWLFLWRDRRRAEPARTAVAGVAKRPL